MGLQLFLLMKQKGNEWFYDSTLLLMIIFISFTGERKRIKTENDKSPNHHMGSSSKDQHNLSSDSASSGSSLGDSKASLRRSTELPACQINTGALTPSMSKQHGIGQAGMASSNRMKSPLGGSGGSSASSTTGGTPSSTGSNRSQMQVSPQCQYPGLSQSTSPYSHMQGSSPEQVYYPHHNNMVAMQMAAANGSSSGLLQPVVTSSLMATQQMASCQLAGQNTACALSSSTNQGLGYNGLASTAGAHATLPSCTYMQNQSSSHSAYQGHLASNMMNIATAAHYPGSLA